MSQAQVNVVLDLSSYGINQQITISVPQTIEGVTFAEGDVFKPRNQIEIDAVERIAGKVAGGIAKSTGNAWNEPLTSGIGTVTVTPLIEIVAQPPQGIQRYVNNNATINVNSHILDTKQESAQAPIKPFTLVKPDNYVARQSSILLGNATKAKKSRKYYHSRDMGQAIDTLINNGVDPVPDPTIQ